MSEITDMFYDECADRKRTARGAFNKRTHNGKRGGVKFPSDYLSKKEKNKMNGAIKVYKMNEPITYAEFKKYPDDLKKQYLNNLREKFDVSDTAIAEMMGVNKKTLNGLLKIIDASGGRRGSRKADYEGFEKWKNAHDVACSSVSAEDSDEYEKLDKEILEEDRDRRESNYRNTIETSNLNMVNYNGMCKKVYKDVYKDVLEDYGHIEALEREIEILKAKLEMVYLIFGGARDEHC